MKTPSPNFDRFASATTRQACPDRLPLGEVHIDVEFMEAFLGRPIGGMKEYVEFWKTAGYDYALLYVRGQPLPDHFHQRKIGQPPQKESATASTFDIPKGVKDEETLEQYPWIQPNDVYYGDVEAIRSFLPDGMKLVVNQGPLFSGIWRIMGLEKFAMACVEQPELVEAVASRIGELCVEIARNIVQREWVGAYWMGDDMAYTGGLMVSPTFLRNTVFPYYKQIGDLCKEYNKPFLHHSDGNTNEVLEDLIACGVNAVHPNELTSVDLAQRKTLWGDRLSFAGGVDVDLLTRGTKQDVANTVTYLIQTVAPGGGYVLGSSNSITKHVPVDNFRTMITIVVEAGTP